MEGHDITGPWDEHNKTTLFWVMDPDGTVRPSRDHEEWMEHFRDFDNRRRLAKEETCGLTVSTVFLGVPHIGNDLTDHSSNTWDFFFETMVFGDQAKINALFLDNEMRDKDRSSIMNKWFNDRVDYQRRYRTYKEAIEGHTETVKMVREILGEISGDYLTGEDGSAADEKNVSQPMEGPP